MNRSRIYFVAATMLLEASYASAQIAFFNIPDGNVAALKSAIATSNSDGVDDIIVLAANGTYNLTGPDNITAEGANGLPAIGADNGHFVTIQGQGATIRRNVGPPAYFRILEATQGAQLNVFSVTIMGGYWLSNAGARASGGGILGQGATVTLMDCVITGNTVRTGAGTGGGGFGDGPQNSNAAAGGGVCNASFGILNITRCTFTNNSAIGGDARPGDLARSGAHAFGGAVNFANTLTDCTFSNNTAVGGAGIAGTPDNIVGGEGGAALGGGVSFAGDISGCTFTNNSASGGAGGAGGNGANFQSGNGGNAEGGGVDIGPWMNSSVTNCSFNDNTITGGASLNFTGDAFGGGLNLRTSNASFFWSNIMTVNNCTLSGNSAAPAGSAAGGGLFINAAISHVSNCTFATNTAAFQGGAIYYHGNPNLPNSPPQLMLFNCTFSVNNSSAGSTFYAPDREGDFANNIFKAGSVVSNLGGPGLHSLGHNISTDNGSGFLTGPGDLINTDPRLTTTTPQNNGGPTKTIAIGQFGVSPAINAGDDTRAPSRDQRSYTRNGTSDIGAFELGGVLAPVTAVSRKNHNGTDFDLNLPLTGPTAGVECRRNTSSDTSGPNAGHDHQVIVTFPYPVTIDSATGDHGVTADALAPGLNQVYTVNLHNVPNAQLIALSLNGVRDNTNTFTNTIPMGMLLADTNGDGTVNAADISQTKSKSGLTLGATNFLGDLNIDGSLNSADVSLVKSRSGTGLPPQSVDLTKNSR